ncbi:MAG TPA: BTAD domain-containing putative transcriptional regulator [Anaerolineales bacterium]|nr:BTAD domain-containing putative transcriptional regulator [Anaerolineales bacterium]
MSRLSLSLLGPLLVRSAGELITAFDSNKVRALLAYLAVEADRAHSREGLATLLWPDLPQRSALANLRYALSDLRRVIGDREAQPPFLLVSQDTLQFNPASDFDLDVRAFADGVRANDVELLPQATSLYRGPFLEGFAVSDSAEFEEWVVLKREQLSHQMVKALSRLAEHFEALAQYDRAQQYAWQLVELEPWQEEGYQLLMRALALGGQRSAALAQFETCRRILAKELGVEPSAEMTAIYEGIRDGTWMASQVRAPLPAFLRPNARPIEKERPLFVGREQELARLDQLLNEALSGLGQVAFVTGGPGSGKTTLIQELAQRALSARPQLITANGFCNAHTGIGDPYLPFLEILQMLTGDVEDRWAVGAVSSEHARRLWATLPTTVSALIDDGPLLIDRFVPGVALLARAQVGAQGQASRLDAVLRHLAAGSEGATVRQTDLFEQYTKVLHALARNHPVLLAVDDLQWADAGSISLLFHVGRRLKGHRILIVGAYRPSDVALGRGGERHPLESVVNELQLEFGRAGVDLAQAEGRPFVDALLDAEPNRLGRTFRETLHRHTGGHALFTVELLRGLQERGDLIQDETGQWIEGPAIDWGNLPPRVEAVIAERIGRLPEDLRATLVAASVEGEEFTAEAVARVEGLEPQEVIRRLSGFLEKQHRLVSAAGVHRTAQGHISRYRFRHFLFQKYVYSRLDTVQKVHLHESMGRALEEVYGRAAGDIAVPLAWHFEMAGMISTAVSYLLQAGNRAAQLSAHEEAIAHFRKGLAMLEGLPDSLERARQELALQMSLGVSVASARGYADPEMGEAYGRARDLCRQMGATPELFPVLTGLGGFFSLRGDCRTALEVYEEILAAAQGSADPVLLTIGEWGMGYILVITGKFADGRAHLERALSHYDPRQHRALISTYYQDPGVSCLTWLSWALLMLGYPDRALKRSREALALAEDLGHPFTRAFAQGLAAALCFYRLDPVEARQHAEATIALSRQSGFPMLLSVGKAMRGWALVRQGSIEAGQTELREGIAFLRASGTRQPLPAWLTAFADTCVEREMAEEGLDALAEAEAEATEEGGHFDESEINRLRGELLLRFGMGEGEAEASFHKAIAAARRQSAKLWELRATMNLARLWQRQGRREEARQRLAKVYGWFTEGFDSPDLKEARELLDQLAAPEPSA